MGDIEDMYGKVTSPHQYLTVLRIPVKKFVPTLKGIREIKDYRFLYSRCEGMPADFDEAKRIELDNLGAGFNKFDIEQADAIWFARIDKEVKIDMEKESYQWKVEK